MTATATEPQALLERLADVIRPRQRLITAYSGGVDSTLVAVVARQTLGRDAAPAVIGDSASLPRAELDDARRLARDLDLHLIEVQPGEQDDPGYQANAGDRCYHCKTHLYAALHTLAAKLDVPWIANGAITDDLGDYRPGLKAAGEAGVVSPLVEAGFDKLAVRALALHLKLPNADKPAAACLASRLPYGTPVTLQRLSQVERAESVLRELGFRGFRVRHHDTAARIELPTDQWPRLLEEPMRRAVVEGVKAAGYHYVAFDLEGFRSGSANVTLTTLNKPKE
ncbi:MAG: ATP-dependent sacrificial sulfur transferase LarE [Planctomycetota bacterium]|nr:ATP-dependent sacrificial sulfur transferase LarE [Planctomycetota bacterium]